MATKPVVKAPTIAIEGSIPKLTLSMPLDAKKIKAIQKCMATGELKISISKVDLGAGRIGQAYLYD